MPGFLGVKGLLAFLDLFVPMTGRMGHDAHVDFMIASLVSAVGFNMILISLPLAHRFSRQALGWFLVLLLMLSSLVGFWFTRPNWKIFVKGQHVPIPVHDKQAQASACLGKLKIEFSGIDQLLA
ncbi:hypothetical protein PGT21_010699 [Puccinia graminis f. sp. tritici]|uniref:Uncharacterized protein n=2 Tax=Puccinia graminis f. sp. tritici TaxID=56615 RepID=A0A5B0N287_PUCGR|nr:hypothetical protein PGT21_010699 [Puccinia graminis f. sp. tritici]